MRNWKYEKKVYGAPEDFEERNAAVIVKVANGSPAQKIGLIEGDRIISFNGDTLLRQSELDDTSSTSTSRYQFYLHLDNSILDLEVDPLPLGIVTETSSHRLAKDFKAFGFPGWEGLRLLWKRREWEKLLKAADSTYWNLGLSRLIRVVSRDFGKNAGMLYAGAALFEMEREEEGIEIISDFINSVMPQYETAEQAVAFFYAARWSELIGDREEMERWLEESDKSNGGQFERISQEVYFKGIQPYPGRYCWTGKEFPLSYSLQKLGKEQKISLSSTLSGMSADQLLPICVMPSYRANGPYNDSIGCYGSIYAYVSDRILPLHIILDTLEPEKRLEWARENEDRLSNNGIPFELLHDPESSVSESLEIDFSPVFYLLNNAGIVVYDGPLFSGFDYWTILESNQSEKA